MNRTRSLLDYTSMFSLGAKLYNLAVGKKRAAPEESEQVPQTSAVRAKIIHRSTLSSDKMTELPTVPAVVPAVVPAEPAVELAASEAVVEDGEEDATAPSDAPPSQESESDLDDGRTPGTTASELMTLRECYSRGSIPTISSGVVAPAFAVDEELNDKVIVWSVFVSACWIMR